MIHRPICKGCVPAAAGAGTRRAAGRGERHSNEAGQQAERRGERISIKEALTRVGVRDWPIGSLKKTEEALIQLGRVRAGKIYRWLMETDLALKGSHSQANRARFVLEQLFLRMSKEATPPTPKVAGRR